MDITFNSAPAAPAPTPAPADPQRAAEASFDIVARQDRTEGDVAALRSDVDEVKSRVDRISRAAARPAIGGADEPAPEVKGFVEHYLRRGATSEYKSISGAVETSTSCGRITRPPSVVTSPRKPMTNSLAGSS